MRGYPHFVQHSIHCLHRQSLHDLHLLILALCSDSDISNEIPNGTGSTFIAFKALNHYMPSIVKQTFRGVPLHHNESSSECDLYILGDDDRRDLEEYDEQTMQDGNDWKSKWNIVSPDLLSLDDEKIDFGDIDDPLSHGLQCCDGKFGKKRQKDRPKLSVDKYSLPCSRCKRLNHVFCLKQNKDCTLSSADLERCRRNKAVFVCPTCIGYHQAILAGLNGISEWIDDLLHFTFSVRFDIENLLKSKHGLFHRG